MDFKLSPDEISFVRGVRAFLEEEAQHPDAHDFMDPDRDCHSQLPPSRCG